jgi:hypothetical protein
VFELIVSKCSDVRYGWRSGGLDASRLANRRFKQVVESGTTWLMNHWEDGADTLPVALDQRCRRIVEITCWSTNLRSLEGCPDGLKRLHIGNSPDLSDLSPLASCSRMKSLRIHDSSVNQCSPQCPLLKILLVRRDRDDPPSTSIPSRLARC